MKIIGEGRGVYICEISAEEVRKVLGKAYADRPVFGIGDTVNLAAGYDFRSDIRDVCNDMTRAMQGFAKAQQTLQRFAMMVAALPPEP